jgi:hypothetical protein
VLGEKPGGVDAGGDAELAQGRAQVFVDGVGAHDPGDLLGLHVLIDQPQHLTLPRRQALQRGDLVQVRHALVGPRLGWEPYWALQQASKSDASRRPFQARLRAPYSPVIRGGLAPGF